MHRSQYLHARETLQRLLDLGVLPDRQRERHRRRRRDPLRRQRPPRRARRAPGRAPTSLLLLTDTGGLFTADPRLDAEASLIEEIVEVDEALEALAGGAGTERGSGGMASKLAAAKIAAWSGVRAVIASAAAPDVVLQAIDGADVGTVVHPRRERLSSRKLWIAFALGAAGRVVVDEGARKALRATAARCSPPACAASRAPSTPTPRSRSSATTAAVRQGPRPLREPELAAVAGRGPSDLPEGAPHEVVHRDDLVVLP